MIDGKCRDMVPLTGMVRRWAWRLNHRMAHWPLSPPSWWCRRPVWVAIGLAVWAGEVLTPAALHMMPLGLVPVLLAAWCGDFIWSLGLALGLPWGACLSWWWQGAPWALWVEVVNALGQTAATMIEKGLFRDFGEQGERHHPGLRGICYRMQTLEGTDEWSPLMSESRGLAHRHDRFEAGALPLLPGPGATHRRLSGVWNTASARA